ncbi:MAG: LamG-like jellyroll fold domain-containing protein [Verrucomicrobiota bacterium]
MKKMLNMVVVLAMMAAGAYASVQIVYTGETDASICAIDRYGLDGEQNGYFISEGTDRFVHVDATGAPRFGKRAYRFKAGVKSNDAIEISQSTCLGTSFTLAGYVAAESNNLQRLFSSYDNSFIVNGLAGEKASITKEKALLFDFDPDGSSGFSIRAMINGEEIKVKTDGFDDGKYHHLAMTYDDGDVKLYLDGKMVAEGKAGSGAITLTKNLRVGEDRLPVVDDQQLHGDVDDLVVWSTAMKPNEIKKLCVGGAVRLLSKCPPRKQLSRGRFAKDALHTIIAKEDGVYGGWPDLFVHPDGRLVMRYFAKENADHIDYSGGCKVMFSSDGGYTWEYAEGGRAWPRDDDGPFINRDWVKSDGRLVKVEGVGWVEVPASQKEELEAQHKHIMPNPMKKDIISYLGGVKLSVSTDKGRTWEHCDLELPEEFTGGLGYNRGASELLTSDDVFLYAMYLRRWRDGHPTFGVEGESSFEGVFIRSADEGKTWRFIEQVPGGLDTKVHPSGGLNETALVENNKGEIIAQSRTQKQGHMLYQSISKDGGLTWSMPEYTGIDGVPSHLLKLKDGRILCSYGFRRSGGSPIIGIFARVSDDDGHTWPSLDEQIIIREDGSALGESVPGDSGYPISFQLEDGTIFTIYYITGKDGVTHVAGTHWRLD